MRYLIHPNTLQQASLNILKSYVLLLCELLQDLMLKHAWTHRQCHLQSPVAPASPAPPLPHPSQFRPHPGRYDIGWSLTLAKTILAELTIMRNQKEQGANIVNCHMELVDT